MKKRKTPAPAKEPPRVKLQPLLSQADKRELALAEEMLRHPAPKPVPMPKTEPAPVPEKVTYVKRVTAPAKPKVKKVTAVRVKNKV